MKTTNDVSEITQADQTSAGPSVESTVGTDNEASFPISEPLCAETQREGSTEGEEANFHTLKRGPELASTHPRVGSRFPHADIAQVALTTGIPLAVVGLTSKKVVTAFRINLGAAALAAALRFDVSELTPEDKQKKVEVIIHGEEVAEALDAAIEQHGLRDRVEFYCPDEPIILNARFARVPPHTPSISVAWPDDWPRPIAGRTKAFVVPVKMIRIRPEVVSESVSGREAPASASRDDVLQARHTAAALADASLDKVDDEGTAQGN